MGFRPQTDGRGRISWQVYYRITAENGWRRRIFRAGFQRKSLAEGFYQAQLDACGAGRLFWELDGAGKIALSKLIEDFHTIRSAGNRPRSIVMDRLATSHLMEFLGGDRPAENVTQEEVEAFLAARAAKGRKPKTRNRELRTLRALFNAAIDWGRLDVNPTAKVKAAKEPEKEVVYLSPEEQGLVLGCAREIGGDPRVNVPYAFALIALALQTGMRRMELFHLRWGDIDFGRRTARVRNEDNEEGAWETKSGKARTIGLTDFAMMALRGWREWFAPEIAKARARAADGRIAKQLREKASIRLGALVRCQPRADGFIFPSFRAASADRGQVPLDNCGSMVDNVRKRAKLKRFGLHILRHSFAVGLARAGVPIRILQQLLGHGSLRMTEVYLRFYPDEGMREVDRLAAPVIPEGRVEGVKVGGASAGGAPVVRHGSARRAERKAI